MSNGFKFFPANQSNRTVTRNVVPSGWRRDLSFYTGKHFQNQPIAAPIWNQYQQESKALTFYSPTVYVYRQSIYNTAVTAATTAGHGNYFSSTSNKMYCLTIGGSTNLVLAEKFVWQTNMMLLQPSANFLSAVNITPGTSGADHALHTGWGSAACKTPWSSLVTSNQASAAMSPARYYTCAYSNSQYALYAGGNNLGGVLYAQYDSIDWATFTNVNRGTMSTVRWLAYASGDESKMIVGCGYNNVAQTTFANGACDVIAYATWVLSVGPSWPVNGSAAGCGFGDSVEGIFAASLGPVVHHKLPWATMTFSALPTTSGIYNQTQMSTNR